MFRAPVRRGVGMHVYVLLRSNQTPGRPGYFPGMNYSPPLFGVVSRFSSPEASKYACDVFARRSSVVYTHVYPVLPLLFVVYTFVGCLAC